MSKVPITQEWLQTLASRFLTNPSTKLPVEHCERDYRKVIEAVSDWYEGQSVKLDTKHPKTTLAYFIAFSYRWPSVLDDPYFATHVQSPIGRLALKEVMTLGSLLGDTRAFIQKNASWRLKSLPDPVPKVEEKPAPPDKVASAKLTTCAKNFADSQIVAPHTVGLKTLRSTLESWVQSHHPTATGYQRYQLLYYTVLKYGSAEQLSEVWGSLSLRRKEFLAALMLVDRVDEAKFRLLSSFVVMDTDDQEALKAERQRLKVVRFRDACSPPDPMEKIPDDRWEEARKWAKNEFYPRDLIMKDFATLETRVIADSLQKYQEQFLTALLSESPRAMRPFPVALEDYQLKPRNNLYFKFTKTDLGCVLGERIRYPTLRYATEPQFQHFPSTNQKEFTMQNPVVTITYLYGEDITKMSEDRLLSSIVKLEAAAAKLKAINAKSTKIAESIKQIEAAVALVTKTLDAKPTSN